MRKTGFSFLFFLLLFSPKNTYAESQYVLPYPSAMPGTVWYKVHKVVESVEQYWYFGSFSQFTYNLKQSDRYLVEAKTLFEYKQYLLADQALQRSSYYFKKIHPSLRSAKLEGKDITVRKAVYAAAAKKHSEVLLSLLTFVPETFMWSPENLPAVQLALHAHIKEAILIRGDK